MQYLFGAGVKRNPSRAFQILDMAKDEKHPLFPEILNLKGFLLNGNDIPVNYAEAIRLYRQAAEAGNITCKTVITSLLNNRPELAVICGYHLTCLNKDSDRMATLLATDNEAWQEFIETDYHKLANYAEMLAFFEQVLNNLENNYSGEVSRILCLKIATLRVKIDNIEDFEFSDFEQAMAINYSLLDQAERWKYVAILIKLYEVSLGGSGSTNENTKAIASRIINFYEVMSEPDKNRFFGEHRMTLALSASTEMFSALNYETTVKLSDLTKEDFDLLMAVIRPSAKDLVSARIPDPRASEVFEHYKKLGYIKPIVRESLLLFSATRAEKVFDIEQEAPKPGEGEKIRKSRKTNCLYK